VLSDEVAAVRQILGKGVLSVICYRQLCPYAIMASCEWQLTSAHEHEYVSEFDFLLRKDGTASKSTLARDLAVRENAVLLVQDDFLDALFPGEITDIPGFVKCSSRLKNTLTPHVCAVSKGISVVLDFPGNTKTQRAWFRELIEPANVEHELHFVDASDALCKSQLRDRSEGLHVNIATAIRFG
jgi:predicted kinase